MRVPPEPVQILRGRRDAALSRIVEGIPFIAFLGLRFDRRGDKLTAVLPYSDDLIGNPLLPALHGGATAGFLESTAIVELAWAAMWEEMETGHQVPKGPLRLPKTIDITVDYLRSGLPRDAYARARVNRSGRRYASVHVEAWQDNRSRLFAQATGHFLMPEAPWSSEPITHARVLRIALPIVLSNATVPLLGAVDTGVIGQMGAAAPIGAVGIGAIVIGAITWVFGFLRMGTTGLTAQARGAGDAPEVAALLSRALLIGGAAGVVLILLQSFLFTGAFLLSPATPEVEALARQYLSIRIWSAPAAIAVFGINGWLIAQERTRAVLVLQLWMNGLNIALDLLFVLSFGWGVPGVATATLIAEWSGLALGLWLCRDAFLGTAWRDRARVFDPARLRNMAVVNGDILVRTLCLEAIFVSFLFWGAGQGDVTLAANQVLLQFLNITAYALDGFAFAAEALVGQAFGARATGSLRQGVRTTSVWGAGIAAALALAFAAFGPWAIDVMTTAPEVRESARAFLPWMVAAPLMGIASWMLDGIFIGATRTRDMRNMMVLSALVYFAAAWPLMGAWGNHGLWAALHVSFVARAVLLASRYPALERAAA